MTTRFFVIFEVACRNINEQDNILDATENQALRWISGILCCYSRWILVFKTKGQSRDVIKLMLLISRG